MFPRLPHMVLALALALLAPARADVLAVSFLGHPVSISWTAPTAPVADLAETLAAEVKRLEDLLGTGPDQWLGRINASAGGDALEIPSELLGFLVRCREYWRMSEGSVDVSQGPLLRLWNFDERTYSTVPRVHAVREALTRVDLGKVTMQADPPRIRLPAEFHLDAGRMGLGMVVDRLHELLGAAGVASSRVEIPGLARVAGPDPSGTAWELRLHPPRKPLRTAARLKPKDTAVVTCAEDQRFITIRGERHHDVIDPRTGWPAQGCSLVTVLAPRAEYAQFLASVLMTQSPEVGLSYLRKHPGVEAVWVGLDNRLVATPALRPLLETAPSP